MPALPLDGLWSVLPAGLALGLRHAFEVDHLSAVAATITRQGRGSRPALVAALWGLGHALALLVLGGAVVAAGLVLPPPVAVAAEAAVGLVLLLLGADAVAALRRERLHIHEHEHDGERHVHLHGHRHAEAHAHAHVGRRAFLVGTLHGLAGSGLLALLAATARSPLEGIALLALFGFGATAGMVLAALALSLPLRLGGAAGARRLGRMRAASALLALASGLLVLIRVARP